MGYCILIGDWNVHHRAWSPDGRGGLSGGVLRSWMQERGVELVIGEWSMFKRTREGVRVASRIDFAVVGGG